MKGDNSHIYQNLQGYHNIDRKFVQISRHGDLYDAGSFTQVKGHKISFDVSVLNLSTGSFKDVERKTDAERYGKWKVISHNPDSIEIDDPKSFFSGRYSVDFGIAYGFPPPPYNQDTLWTVLENDSTHLVLYKLSSSKKEEEKWLGK